MSRDSECQVTPNSDEVTLWDCPCRECFLLRKDANDMLDIDMDEDDPYYD